MRAIIYTRVSDIDQIEGTSLKSQLESCQRYCEQHSFEIVAQFTDEGQSAKSLALNNRKAFLAALDYCKTARPRIEGFVVYRVDRFARNIEDHFAVRRILAGYGTAIHSVTEPIGNTPSEKFIETVLAGAAEYDNEIRKQRCVGGLIARIDQGIWPFKAPLGYVCANHHRRGEKKTVPDRPHEKLFPIIQKALLGYMSGDLASQTAIIRQLNASSFGEWAGFEATSQLVSKMLNKWLPFYAGMLRDPWTLEEKPGRHVPMINAEQAATIRQRLVGASPRLPRKQRSGRSVFPLKGIVRCSACKRLLAASTSRGRTGKQYKYYYCWQRECAMRLKTHRAPRLHDEFEELLRGVEVVSSSALAERIAVLWEERTGETADIVENRRKRVAELGARRRRIEEMREDGTYSADVCRERLNVVDSELAELLGNERGNRPKLTLSIALDDAHWYAQNVRELWTKAIDHVRSRFEQLTFPHGIFPDSTGGIRTADLGLILALSSARMHAESSDVYLETISSNQMQEYFAELHAVRAELETMFRDSFASRVPQRMKSPDDPTSGHDDIRSAA